MNTAKLIACGALAAASGAFAQCPVKPVKVVNDATYPASQANITFDVDTVYHLSGRVFIGQSASNPQTLTIEPGTVIKGLPGDLSLAATLIITKWGTINAIGTAAAPITFTTVYDNECDPTDLGAYDRAFWGGVIVLGEAPISESVPQSIEGIPSEPRAEYGGSVLGDNSGTISYVSIRHGGKLIGGANEINGLTMGGVGSGTTIDHVEVFANMDDGFEWFGGDVNAKYLVSAYGNDDAFDFDFGYRGKLQHAFGIYHNGNTDASGNQGIEGDGYQFPVALDGSTDTLKYSKPKWANLTLIGSGAPVSTLWGTANDFAFRIREGAGGDYMNSIFSDWRAAAGRFDVGGPCWGDCRILADSLNFDGSIFNNFGSYLGNPATWTTDLFTGLSSGSRTTIDATSDYANPGLGGTGVTIGSVDPRPTVGGPAFTIPKGVLGDPFFDVTSYSGAFGLENWAYKWTAIWQSGIMKRHLRVQPGVSNHLETTYRPARIRQSAKWDFVLYQANQVPVNTALSTAFLDNNNVTSTFQAGVWPLGVNNAVTGERTYTVPNQSGSIFGGLGKHSLRLRMVLTNGQVLEDEFFWETVN